MSKIFLSGRKIRAVARTSLIMDYVSYSMVGRYLSIFGDVYSLCMYCTYELSMAIDSYVEIFGKVSVGLSILRDFRQSLSLGLTKPVMLCVNKSM
jgi:hypothetical protein